MKGSSGLGESFYLSKRYAAARIEELEKALEFYADEHSYLENKNGESPIKFDEGCTAQAALKGGK